MRKFHGFGEEVNLVMKGVGMCCGVERNAAIEMKEMGVWEFSGALESLSLWRR